MLTEVRLPVVRVVDVTVELVVDEMLPVEVVDVEVVVVEVVEVLVVDEELVVDRLVVELMVGQTPSPAILMQHGQPAQYQVSQTSSHVQTTNDSQSKSSQTADVVVVVLEVSVVILEIL